MSKYVRQEKSQRKHPVVSSSTSILKAPVNPAAVKERPEWKGPGFTKKAPKQPPRPAPTASTSAATRIQKNHLPIELQQLLLNIFRSVFPVCQDYDELKPALQQIKDALSENDFEKAFGRLDWLEAYAVRWSPSRALCYATILVEICQEFREEAWVKRLLGDDRIGIQKSSNCPESTGLPLKVVCFGGGAAEIMAFGAMLRNLLPVVVGKPVVADIPQDTVSESMRSLLISETSPQAPILDLHFVDQANWEPIISSLRTGLMTAPILSKYASAIAKANNAPFIAPDTLKTSFHQSNILESSQDELESMIGAEPALITVFFTLSDLHALAVVKSTAFLLKLTLAAPKNSLLLIIDSIESSSVVAVQKDDEGKEKKRYPMHYLLDMVLMEKELPEAVNTKPAWEKLIADQSRYFRLEEGLKFPMSLENMKFQVYLFRKL
jgi:25S rRNA (uracil2843-N3)-methyltransferase